MPLHFLVLSLQFIYTGMLSYFVLKSFLMAMRTWDPDSAKNCLTAGIIFILSLQVAISLLKTLRFSSLEEILLCASIIAMRALIKHNI